MKSMKRNSRLKKLKACKNNLIRLHMSIIAWGDVALGMEREGWQFFFFVLELGSIPISF